MPCPSPTRTGNRARFAASSLQFLLLAALAAVAILSIAGAAGASNVSYVWAADSDPSGPQSPDGALSEDASLSHDWRAVGYDGDGNYDTDVDREIPNDGYVLVRTLIGEGEEIEEIHFRYDDLSDDTEILFTYDVNGDGTGHEDDDEQNVFLARDVPSIDESDSPQAGSATGCFERDGSMDEIPNFDSTTLRDGGMICFFFIKTDGELDTSEQYGLEVAAGVAPFTDNDFVQENGMDFDDITEGLQPVETGFDTISGDFIGAEDGAIEAGANVLLNVSVQISAGDSSRTFGGNTGDTIDAGFGSVSVWACLVGTIEGENDGEFYENFDAFSVDGSATDWDTPVGCDFAIPDGRADMRDNYNPRPTHSDGDPTALAVPLTFRGGGNDDNDFDNDVRFFEKQLRIDRDEIQTTVDEFIDDFDLHIITRGPVGNVHSDTSNAIEVHRHDLNVTIDPFGEGDRENEDPEEEPSAPSSVSTFTDSTNLGRCFNVTEPEGWGSSRVGGPCYRALDNIPDHEDNPFTFEVEIENYGNIVDNVEVSADRFKGESWTVLVDGEEDSTIIEVPAAVDIKRPSNGLSDANVSVIDPGTQTIEITIIPDNTAVAHAQDPQHIPSTDPDGFMQVDVSASSEDASNYGTPEPVWLEALLVQNARGTLDFDGAPQLETTINASKTGSVDLRIQNTGNTEGPFEVAKTSGPRCEVLGDGDEALPGDISLDISDPPGGTEILPTGQQTRDVQVHVGENVPIGSYECDFGLGDAVTLQGLEPTLVVNVEGVPSLRIFETLAPDRDDHDLTEGELHVTVPPAAGEGTHTVFLFLENVGDAALEPQLVDDDPVDNRYNLDIDAEGTGSTDLTAGFSLPISDPDASDVVPISDLFPGSDSVEIGSNSQHPGGGDWVCVDGTDHGVDDRIVCRIAIEFTFQNAVVGDQVDYTFTWEDQEGTALDATVDVRLDFQHPGTVEVTEVDDTDVEMEGTLTDGHRFDLTENNVPAKVTINGGEPCDGAIDSDTESLNHVEYSFTVASDDNEEECSASGEELIFDPNIADTIAEISLEVRDENGTMLRQVTPVHLDTSAVAIPDEVENEEIHPTDTLQDDDHQSISYLFEPPTEDNRDYPQAGEGVVLLRASEDNTHALEPYSNVSLNEGAIRVGEGQDGDRSIQHIHATSDAVPEYHSDDDRIAGDEDVWGILMDEGPNDDPIRVGDVSITGWGTDDGEIEWTEGWNPLVFRVTDTQGDPIDGDVDINDFELEFKMVLRDNQLPAEGEPDEWEHELADWQDGNVTDTYSFQLGGNDETIHARYLGNGYLAVDLYLPRGLNQSDLDAKATERGSVEGDSLLLADYPQQAGASYVDVEAWGLHMEVDTDDLEGDAYWRLGDLGLNWGNEAGNAILNGTAASSQILKANTGFDMLQEEDPHADPDDEIDRLHVISKFQNGPVSPNNPAPWRTGPGIHDYAAFVLHETEDPDARQTSLGGFETSENLHTHDIRPHSDASMELSIFGLPTRSNAPGDALGDEAYTLQEHETLEGLYSVFFGLPDLGVESFERLLQLRVEDEDVNVDKKIIHTLIQKERLQATSNGLPMPLAFDDPSLFIMGDDVPGVSGPPQPQFDQRAFETRAVPGLIPDRGSFGLAAAVTSHGDDGNVDGFRLELSEDAIFRIEGEGLLSIPTEELPDTGVQNRELLISVGPQPASAVDRVEATLQDPDGDQLEATLSEADPGQWEGTLTPTQIGEHTLTIRAFDTAGGESIVSVTVNVLETAPPEIELDAPEEVDGHRAIQPNGQIQATVSEALRQEITLEERLGGGNNAQPLEEGNVSVSGLLDQATTGEHDPVTFTFDELTEGRVWVNVTGPEGFSNIQGQSLEASDGDGTVEGNVTFNETGTATIHVETTAADTDESTWNVELDVNVAEEDDDGWTTVDPSISCQDIVCEVTHQPSGLSAGDLYQFRITVDTEDHDLLQETYEATVDDTEPTLTIELADGEHVDDDPPVVGPSTTVLVTAEDDVPAGVDDGIITSLVLSAIQAEAETGSTTLSGNEGEATVGQLGATDEGEATLRVNATNLAGLTASQTLTVTVDASGPSIQTPSVEAVGSDVDVSVDVMDEAGVDRVRVFHKAPGASTFTSTSLDHDAGDTYEGTIDDACDVAGTLEYYVTARDAFSNDAELRGDANPFTVDLGDICPEELTVSITDPDDGATVSGTVDIEISTFSPEGLETSVTELMLERNDGTTVELDLEDPTAEAFAWDTRDVEDGLVTISVTITDDAQTATDSITVTVENILQIDGGACPGIEEITVGEGVELCFSYPTSANVTHLDVALYQDGEGIDIIEELEPQADGVYEVTFDISEPGEYELVVIAHMDDGSTEEASTGTFGVASIAEAIAPLGRFITTLVLGVAVAGLAAFAAFGRWN